jgi:hypothetical protein
LIQPRTQSSLLRNPYKGHRTRTTQKKTHLKQRIELLAVNWLLDQREIFGRHSKQDHLRLSTARILEWKEIQKVLLCFHAPAKPDRRDRKSGHEKSTLKIIESNSGIRRCHSTRDFPPNQLRKYCKVKKSFATHRIKKLLLPDFGAAI